MADNKLFQEPKATELTNMRIQARRKRRITYNCMNAVVSGNSVVCKKSHEFPSIGTRREKGMPLLSVLRGMSSSACKECKDYDEERDE